jgi:hypothetical protein
VVWAARSPALRSPSPVTGQGSSISPGAEPARQGGDHHRRSDEV